MGNVNSFITEIIGIEKLWKVESVTFDGIDAVDIELGYIRSLRPKAPGCPERGSEETLYYDMVDKTWRHTDMCDQIRIIHGKLPRIKCKACGKVSRVKAPWAADTINNYTDSFEPRSLDYPRPCR